MAGSVTASWAGLDALDRVKESCRRVCAAAMDVSLDRKAIEKISRKLTKTDPASPPLDPACHYLADAADTVAYFLTLEAINFGSADFGSIPGWGVDGYLAVAAGLKGWFEEEGVPSAGRLREVTGEECAAFLSLPTGKPAATGLAQRFAERLREFGEHLVDRYEGSFLALVESADRSAVRLVEQLVEIPGFRDEAIYHDVEGFFPVAFYKRAQITAADLALALGGEGWGRFDDLDRLTCFADNQVPHVLRGDGVLRYSDDLAATIEAGWEIPTGSSQEVEIRAATIIAVEEIRRSLALHGRRVTSVQLDHWFWNRGLELPFLDGRPHRTQTDFY